MDGKFYAERQPWAAGIALHFAQEGDFTFAVAQPIVMQEAERNQITRPFMELGIRAAQQLMDELWHCGLRPTEGSGSAGSLAATERHLSDMRKLVFKDAP